MTDDSSDEERALEEAVAVAAVAALLARFWSIVNDRAMNYAQTPHVVAHASAELLARVLVACASTDPQDLAFSLRLIDEVQQQLLLRTGTSTAPATMH